VNENCTNPDADVNKNGLKGCQDPSCAGQKGADYNNPFDSTFEYNKDKPTCLLKNGCKCEYKNETICNDGFNNDADKILQTPIMGNIVINLPIGKELIPSKIEVVKILPGVADLIKILSPATDCMDSNCINIKAKGPGNATCCVNNTAGAICGPDYELHQTNCVGSTDEDGDKLFGCGDPDCDGQVCGKISTIRNMVCYAGNCIAPPEAGVAPVEKKPKITFFTYADILSFLHSGKVIKEKGDCNSICGKQGMVCGFAQGGKHSCNDPDSTYCTCYAMLEGVEGKKEEAAPPKPAETPKSTETNTVATTDCNKVANFKLKECLDQPCSVNGISGKVTWSYNLPQELDNYNQKTTPNPNGGIACCTPNQCSYGGKNCANFDQVVGGNYICGNNNNWKVCTSSTTGPSDGGKYKCDGSKWVQK